MQWDLVISHSNKWVGFFFWGGGFKVKSPLNWFVLVINYIHLSKLYIWLIQNKVEMPLK